MTPHPRWRRKNRPQIPPIALRRSDFRPKIPEQKVKKIARGFERPAKVLRLMNVGAVIPPHRLYSARAPIHPKRPYGLTRPVVPPDGSFIFGTGLLEEAASRAAPRRLAGCKLPSVCATRRYFPQRLFKRNFRGPLRNAVMLAVRLD